MVCCTATTATRVNHACETGVVTPTKAAITSTTYATQCAGAGGARVGASTTATTAIDLNARDARSESKSRRSAGGGRSADTSTTSTASTTCAVAGGETGSQSAGETLLGGS